MADSDIIDLCLSHLNDKDTPIENLSNDLLAIQVAIANHAETISSMSAQMAIVTREMQKMQSLHETVRKELVTRTIGSVDNKKNNHMLWKESKSDLLQMVRQIYLVGPTEYGDAILKLMPLQDVAKLAQTLSSNSIILTCRTANTLARRGIMNAYALSHCTYESLSRINHFGKLAMTEVETLLMLLNRPLKHSYEIEKLSTTIIPGSSRDVATFLNKLDLYTFEDLLACDLSLMKSAPERVMNVYKHLKEQPNDVTAAQNILCPT